MAAGYLRELQGAMGWDDGRLIALVQEWAAVHVEEGADLVRYLEDCADAEFGLLDCASDRAE